MNIAKPQRPRRSAAHLSFNSSINLSGLVVALLLGACSGSHVLGVVNPDAQLPSGTGGTNGGAGGTNGGALACTPLYANGAGGSPAPNMNANTGSASAMPPPPESLGAAQRWTGYIEGRTYASGSESIKVTMASDSSGNLAGTVVFGEGPPPAPPTDANVGYPSSSSNTWPAEGFVYQLHGAKLTAQHLTFHVALRQLWSSWCALQTPIGPGEESCAPAGTFTDTSDGGCTFRSSCGGQLLDCQKVLLCNRFCYCPGGTCKVFLDLGPNYPLDDMFFDLFLTGDAANGTAAGYGLGSSPTHFTKDAPTADGGT
jgi:hypothetical protein